MEVYKKEILNSQYYDSPAMFHQSINTFFQNINDIYNQQIQKLLTLNFQFFENTITHSYAALSINNKDIEAKLKKH